jgi:PPOX class probable F420-dependent enzyme
MKIDTTTAFGQRVHRRLQEEVVIWLTTVDASGTPQPRPVWFFWDGESFLIYSRPDTAKLRHIERNPQVALNFDGNGKGGDIVVFTGTARIAADSPPSDEHPAYLEKYRADIGRLEMTPRQFARAYAVAVEVVPDKVRGH